MLNMTTELMKPVAQKFEQKARTADVMIDENATFASLLLHPAVQEGLTLAGFERPSPIQIKAIPLGRCGCDLIVQAKSGTGKTCVFAVIALESIDLESDCTQVVVLAPTREIAVQIWEVIKSLGMAMTNLHCYVFIGGMPLADDKQKLKHCHIAVATPGRFKQLIEMEAINVNNVRLFVLDEADKLLEEGFQEDINWIYSSLPTNKQVLALSATFPESLAQQLKLYMRTPFMVRLNTCDPALLGISQYYKVLPFLKQPFKMREAKTAFLLQLLSSVEFQQCLVFSNSQFSAEELMNKLNTVKWPSAYICGSMPQDQRLKVMAKFRFGRVRVLISTDLTSRGIDVENVNLVINFDLPSDHETYLHRNGRAGRFGSFGAAISVISQNEVEEFSEIERRCQTTVQPLPDPIPEDLVSRKLEFSGANHVTVERFSQGQYVEGQIKEPFLRQNASTKELSPVSCSGGADGDSELASNNLFSNGVANSLAKIDSTPNGCSNGDTSFKPKKICSAITATENGSEDCLDTDVCKSKSAEDGKEEKSPETLTAWPEISKVHTYPNFNGSVPHQTSSQTPTLDYKKPPEQAVSLEDLLASYKNVVAAPEMKSLELSDLSEALELTAEIDMRFGNESFALQIDEVIERSGKDYAVQFPNCLKLWEQIKDICEGTPCDITEMSGKLGQSFSVVLPPEIQRKTVPESCSDLKSTMNLESETKASSSNGRITYTREQLFEIEKRSRGLVVPSCLAEVVDLLDIKLGTVYPQPAESDVTNRGAGGKRYGGTRNFNTSNNYKTRNRPQNSVFAASNTDVVPLFPELSVKSDQSYSGKAVNLVSRTDDTGDRILSVLPKECAVSESKKVELSMPFSRTFGNQPFSMLDSSGLAQDVSRSETVTSPSTIDHSVPFPQESHIISEEFLHREAEKDETITNNSECSALEGKDAALSEVLAERGDNIQIGENSFEKSSLTAFNLNSAGFVLSEDVSIWASSPLENITKHIPPTEHHNEHFQNTCEWNRETTSSLSKTPRDESVIPASRQQTVDEDSGDHFQQKRLSKKKADGKVEKSSSDDFSKTANAHGSIESGMLNGLYWKPSKNQHSERDKLAHVTDVNKSNTSSKQRSESSFRSLKGEKSSDKTRQKPNIDSSSRPRADKQTKSNSTAGHSNFSHQMPSSTSANAFAYSSYCWNNYVNHMQQAEYFRQLYLQHAEHTRLQNMAVQQWSYIDHLVKGQRKY